MGFVPRIITKKATIHNSTRPSLLSCLKIVIAFDLLISFTYCQTSNARVLLVRESV